MVRVKICGNKNIDEVLIASRLGADAIGLIVGVSHFSEDAIKPSEAEKNFERNPCFCNYRSCNSYENFGRNLKAV